MDTPFSEAALRLRHDLGKYVTMAARWLPDDPAEAELRAALSDDLLHTARGPAGDRSAAEVWAGLRGEWEGAPPALAARVRELDERVARLDAGARRLDDLRLPELRELAAEAAGVSALCRELVAAAREGSEP